MFDLSWSGVTWPNKSWVAGEDLDEVCTPEDYKDCFATLHRFVIDLSGKDYEAPKQAALGMTKGIKRSSAGAAAPKGKKAKKSKE